MVGTSPSKVGGVDFIPGWELRSHPFSLSFPLLCLLSYLSLPFGTAGYSRLTLYISGPSSRISHFPKDPWLLSLKNDIRNQDLDT